MSEAIIPNCYHPDGTPCIAFGIQADTGYYTYTSPPLPNPSIHTVHPHGVPEPGTMALLVTALILGRIRRWAAATP